MQNFPTKVDGISVLPAAEYNNLTSELKNVVTTSGQLLSTAEVFQLAKAIANYVANGTYYTDSGVVNAYNLTVVGSKAAPTSYLNGLTATFKVGNTNTGASTVNVASLGIKNIKKNGGSDNLAAGDLPANKLVTIIYDSTIDAFVVSNTEFVAKEYLKADEYTTINTGYGFSLFDMGNSGTGTKTPLLANGFIQTLTINGNFTLGAPTESDSGWIDIRATNDGTGGYTINTSAYTIVQDNYDNSASKVNLFRILKVGSTSYLTINPVPMTSGGGGGGAISGGASYVSPIINGALNVWQRGTSFSSASNGAYTADRWKYIKSGSMVHTVSRSTSVPGTDATTNYTQYSLSAITTTNDSSISSTDYVAIEQPIEGTMFQTIAQKQFTISFWVKSPVTGTYSVAFVNGGGNRSYIGEYTITSSNAWERKSITVDATPGAGTWNYTTGTGLRVIFTLAAGSNFRTSANAWQTGLYFASSNQVNAVGTIGNEFNLTGVQIEVGDTASAFITENFTDTLIRCQRYYIKSFNYDTAPASNTESASRINFPNTNSVGSLAVTFSYPFCTTMRTTPTITTYNPYAAGSEISNGTDTATGTGVWSGGDKHFSLVYTVPGGTQVGTNFAYHFTAEAEL